MRAITEKIPLTEIRMNDGETFFIKTDPETFEKIKATTDIIELSLHRHKRIKSVNIKDWGYATGADYFKIIIAPKLPILLRNKITDALHRTELNGISPSLEAILRRLEEFKKEYQNS